MKYFVDANVFRYLVLRPKNIEFGFYQEVWPEQGAILSSVVQDELERGDFPSDKHWDEVRVLFDMCTRVPQIDKASVWFARARIVRNRIGLSNGVGDNDLLVVGQAAQNGWGYISHDRNAIRVARGLNVEIKTAHSDMDLYFAQDDIRLQAQDRD